MSVQTQNFSGELLDGFIEEASTALYRVEQRIEELAPGNDYADAVSEIFRCIHSVKGNSSFFNLTSIGGLAHELESLLDRIRKDELTPSASILELLLEGTDSLARLLEVLRDSGNDTPADPNRYEDVLSRLRGLGAGKRPADPYAFLQREVEGILSLLPEEMDDVRERVAALPRVLSPEQNKEENREPDDNGPLAELESLLFGQDTGKSEAERIEAGQALLADLIESARRDDVRKRLDECLDAYRTITEALGIDPLLRDSVLDPLADIGDDALSPRKGESSPVGEEPASESDAAENRKRINGVTPSGNGNGNGKRTMRVEEEHIDTFLAHVGDLLVVEDMFQHLRRRVGDLVRDRVLDEDFGRATESFSELSESLQSSIMAVRRVPAKSLLQKAPRLARETAKAVGKDIRCILSGEDVLLDKSHVELLDAPLTHMVRNAVDHGIESPDERASAGKEATGRVEVGVEETEAEYILRVRDDGAGLDTEALREKAEALGIIRTGEQLDQKALADLIFRSGVSTAKAVTGISGRGVGMDAVRTAVEEAGGRIEVDSRVGDGTAITVILPKTVTTQIISAYLVSCAEQVWALPLLSVRRAVNRSELEHGVQSGKLAVYDGTSIPVYPLHSLIVTGTATGTPSDAPVLVLLEESGERVFIGVDEIVGVQKVVEREIPAIGREDALVTGAAVLGDGQVALMLRPELLVQQCQNIRKRN